MPKDFNSRWYIAQPKDGDESPIAEAGRVVLNSTRNIRTELTAFRAQMAKNEDLSETGKAKAVAKEALSSMTRYRAAQARIGRELADHRMKLNKKTFEKLPEVASADKWAIAQWLREMPAADRNAVLRDAAAGRMPGGHDVMAVVLGTFPRILGFDNDDPNYSAVRDQYLSTSNPSAAAELLDIEVAENALAHAGDELESWVEEVAPGFGAALNESEGRTEWKDLPLEAKVEAVDGGTDIGTLMRDGTIRPVEETDEERTAWNNLSVAEKLDAVDQRGDRNVVELVRKGR